jgi:hypothetical protein
MLQSEASPKQLFGMGNRAGIESGGGVQGEPRKASESARRKHDAVLSEACKYRMPGCNMNFFSPIGERE